MKFIALKNSDCLCLVDDDDYDRIMSLNTNWAILFKRNKPSAIVSTTQFNRKSIYLHRFVMNFEEQFKRNIDHKDGNIFNNRKENLRVATFSQNQANRPKQVNNTSGYKGVCWSNKLSKWRAYIKKKSKQIHLGYFDDKEEAAKMYDKKALELFGEFANLNFQ